VGWDGDEWRGGGSDGDGSKKYCDHLIQEMWYRASALA
jgi:hypothetical protein